MNPKDPPTTRRPPPPAASQPIRPIGPPNQLLRQGSPSCIGYDWQRGHEVAQILQYPELAWDEISRAVADRRRSRFVRDALQIAGWVALIAAVALR